MEKNYKTNKSSYAKYLELKTKAESLLKETILAEKEAEAFERMHHDILNDIWK